MREVCDKLDIEYDQTQLPEYKSEWRDRSVSIAELYDAETRRIVEVRHAKELEDFGYEMPE